MSEMPDELTDDGTPYIASLYAWMREKVGIDPEELLKGDDWLLIIKLHAMIESALNVALVIELREPRLDKIIGKLDTSDGSRGKVAFAKALEMLEKASVDFLQELSRLRNLCVHNIRNFQFDLFKHLEEYEKANELRTAMIKGMECLTFPSQEIRREIATKNPRMALFLGSMGIMMQLHVHNERCELREAELRLKEAQLSLFQTQAEIQDKIELPQSTSTE